MRVEVKTFAAMCYAEADFTIETESKETDLSKPGNMRWLASHIKWAAKNSRPIKIIPVRA